MEYGVVGIGDVKSWIVSQQRKWSSCEGLCILEVTHNATSSVNLAAELSQRARMSGVIAMLR